MKPFPRKTLRRTARGTIRAKKTKGPETGPAHASATKAAPVESWGQNTAKATQARERKAQIETATAPAASYPQVRFHGSSPPFLKRWQEAGCLPATSDELKAQAKKALEEEGYDILPGKEEDVLKDLYDKRYDLLKLGVPLDMALPGYLWEGYSIHGRSISERGMRGDAEEKRRKGTREDEESREGKKAKKYGRRKYRPQIVAARRVATRLSKVLRSLAKVEAEHPVKISQQWERRYHYRLWCAMGEDDGEEAELPTLELKSATQIRRARRLAEEIGIELTCLDKEAATTGAGAPPAEERNELARRLYQLGSLLNKSEKVTMVAKVRLLLEGRPGNELKFVEDQVRKQFKRLGLK